MTEFDFGHLDKLQIAKTAEVPLPEILNVDGTYPVLIGKFAGESNKPFHNAVLKRMKIRGRRGAMNISARAAKEARDEDKELYPSLVFTGWRNVQTQSGEDVPFSVAAASAFVERMPTWLFDRIRVFFSDPSTFLDENEPDDGDIEVTAGN
jgi:hypothetical protein